jgi:hypothetical protein
MSSEPDTSNDGEVVDGLPVPIEPAAPVPVAEAPRPVVVPVVHAAALAATGFVAGAATAAVVARRRGLAGRRRRKRKGAVGEIMASNSFLVDVHLIRRD